MYALISFISQFFFIKTSLAYQQNLELKALLVTEKKNEKKFIYKISALKLDYTELHISSFH